MSNSIGNRRLYKTLCQVLDSLREESPAELSVYRPPAGNTQALIQARSRALLHLYLKSRFGISSFTEREKLVTDGPMDGGIDAFFIDQKNKNIFILQSKFKATPQNFSSSNMSAEDLLKMDVARILKGNLKDVAGNAYNEKIRGGLQKQLKKLTDAGSYTTRVVLLGNAKLFTKQDLKKLVEGYSVEQFSHEKIYSELLFPVISGTYFNDPNLTIEIQLANLLKETHLDYNVKTKVIRANIKLLFVPTREIGRILKTYQNAILKFNPRSFLELQTNVVNQQIEASIKTQSGNEFALFNNGITIIADGTTISSDTGKQGTAQVGLRNPQLVNGGQTAYVLGRIYSECLGTGNFDVFKGKEVLLRVITFVGPTKKSSEQARLALVADISKASNSQTKIDEADRRSNDPIQLRLQHEFFLKYGLYYERKSGEFSDGLTAGYIKKEDLVNREKLVRVCLATDYRASQARSSIGKYFEESTFGNLLQVKDVEKYAYGYEVLKLLDEERKRKPKNAGDRYHTAEFGQALRYGQYAVVAVCVNRGLAWKKNESAVTSLVLSQWLTFEAWVQSQSSNAAYKVNGSFDWVNYYKGSTIGTDLQAYKFKTSH